MKSCLLQATVYLTFREVCSSLLVSSVALPLIKPTFGLKNGSKALCMYMRGEGLPEREQRF